MEEIRHQPDKRLPRKIHLLKNRIKVRLKNVDVACHVVKTRSSVLDLYKKLSLVQELLGHGGQFETLLQELSKKNAPVNEIDDLKQWKINFSAVNDAIKTRIDQIVCNKFKLEDLEHEEKLFDSELSVDDGKETPQKSVQIFTS